MTTPTPIESLIRPDDEHNRELVANVHPTDWVNPKPDGRYNMVVVGAGTAGLVTAAGAAGLGAKVAHAAKIDRFLVHKEFPTDVRHNAKIFREALTEWAEKKLA